MTEISIKSDFHDISALRFWAAFLLAPVIFTAVTFWAVIPIFALVLGGPFYVVMGGPVAWWVARRHGVSSLAMLIAAGLTVAAILPLSALATAMTGDPDYLDMGFVLAIWGPPFGLFWTAIFIALYSQFSKSKEKSNAQPKS